MQLPFRIYTGEIIFAESARFRRPRKGERRSPSGLEDERPYLSLGVAISQTPRHISAFHSLAFLSLLLHFSFPFSLGESFLLALYLFNADAYYRCWPRSFDPSIFEGKYRSISAFSFISLRIPLRTEIFRVISAFLSDHSLMMLDLFSSRWTCRNRGRMKVVNVF